MLAQAISDKIMQTWKAPPRLSVSAWANEYRQLSPEASAEPGQWSSDRAAFQRGIMDALNSDQVDTVVIMSSSQVGKTEMILNIVGYFISQDPAPILVTYPTLEMAQTWSKDRFAPMIRDSEVFADRIKAPRSKDSSNTLLHKTFPGGHITMAGANSPASLASRPIRVYCGDEIDRYPVSAGAEGDPVGLCVKRTKTFWNRQIFLASTPTIAGLSRIEAAFNESNQQYFHVPCPGCRKYQRLRWANVRWENSDPETARYRCEFCGKSWTEAQRHAAVQKGHWIAERPEVQNIAGFHIWEAYSPWSTLAEIVDDFLRAKGNPERLKVFVNTSLGESWEDEGQKIETSDVLARLEDYPADVPAGGLVITCGVDVQDDRIEGEVVAWGEGDESWSVNFFIITGNLQRPECWERLDELLQSIYVHESGIKLKISCAAIDSGGHMTDQVYRFCRAKEDRRIFPVKGSSTVGHPIISRPSKNNKHRLRLYIVGTDTAKESIMHRLKIEEPGPGYMHFPRKDIYDEEYFAQLAAEKMQIKYRRGYPQRVWVKTRQRNEALDCRVYAMAALAILNPNYERLKKVFAEKAEESKKEPPKGSRRKGAKWSVGWRK